MDSSLEFDDWYDETINQQALDRILEKHKDPETWNGTLEDLMKSSHEINFFKDFDVKINIPICRNYTGGYKCFSITKIYMIFRINRLPKSNHWQAK